MGRIRDISTTKTSPPTDSYIVGDETTGGEKTYKILVSSLLTWLNSNLTLAQSRVTNLVADLAAKADDAATTTALDLKADKSNVLELDNTDSFTPDADYEPATKKYVDDNVGGGAADTLESVSLTTARDIVDADAGKELIFAAASDNDWSGRLKDAISTGKIFTFRNEDSSDKTIGAETTLKDDTGNTLTSYVLNQYGSVTVKKVDGTVFRVLAPASELTPVNLQTGTTYTLQESDAGKVVHCTNASAITVEIPQNTFIAGHEVGISQGGAGTVTVTAGAGVTLNYLAASGADTAGQYDVRMLWFKTANNPYLI